MALMENPTLIAIIIQLVFTLLFFLLTNFWLYKINKKWGEKHAWLSWIPLLNIYSFCTAWKKPLSYLLVPTILVLLSQIIVPVIMFFFMTSLVSSPETAMIFSSVIWVLSLIIMIFVLIRWARATVAISQRTWHGQLMAVWMFFLPFIFYPIVGIKYDPKKENEVVDLAAENSDITESLTEEKTTQL